jgi:hypothetical protein
MQTKNSTTPNQNQHSADHPLQVSPTSFYKRARQQTLTVIPEVTATHALSIGSSLLCGAVSLLERLIDGEPDADDLFAVHFLVDAGKSFMDAGGYAFQAVHHKALDNLAPQKNEGPFCGAHGVNNE